MAISRKRLADETPKRQKVDHADKQAKKPRGQKKASGERKEKPTKKSTLNTSKTQKAKDEAKEKKKAALMASQMMAQIIFKKSTTDLSTATATSTTTTNLSTATATSTTTTNLSTATATSTTTTNLSTATATSTKTNLSTATENSTSSAVSISTTFNLCPTTYSSTLAHTHTVLSGQINGQMQPHASNSSLPIPQQYPQYKHPSGETTYTHSQYNTQPYGQNNIHSQVNAHPYMNSLTNTPPFFNTNPNAHDNVTHQSWNQPWKGYGTTVSGNNSSFLEDLDADVDVQNGGTGTILNSQLSELDSSARIQELEEQMEALEEKVEALEAVVAAGNKLEQRVAKLERLIDTAAVSTPKSTRKIIRQSTPQATSVTCQSIPNSNRQIILNTSPQGQRQTSGTPQDIPQASPQAVNSSTLEEVPRRVELVAGYGVMIHVRQLDTVMRKAKSSATALARLLLVVFFADTILAMSSAKGTKNRPALDSAIVSSIIKFATEKFPESSERDVVQAINSKCSECRHERHSIGSPQNNRAR